jgi:hypothetical protein
MPLNLLPPNERPLRVRTRKPDLRARVNGNLRLDFGDVTLTSYAGLELFARYLRESEFNAAVRQAFAATPAWGDFGLVVMVRLLIGLVILGGRRLRHVAYLCDDLVYRRFAGVAVVPSARTLSRWLKGFSMQTVGGLQALNAAVIARVLPAGALRTLTVDIDGTVASTELQVERAFRGFNPHHRKVPSYYPILAHLAETTHVLRLKNRPGDVHDGKASLSFLRDVWAQLTPIVRRAADVRFRMDGAFFRENLLRWMGIRGAGYAIKVPFYQWLDLQAVIRAQTHWRRVAPDVTGFTVPLAVTPWHTTLTVTIYRKRVHHPSSKNYQLDLFDPNDGHYEYSAVASNLGFSIRALWHFMCGRGGQEKTIGQLKGGLALHSIPTNAYAANSAWQQLVVLAHNLLTNFQIETGAPCRPVSRKRTVRPILQTVQTLRFVLFHRAALLVRPQDSPVLRLTDNAETKKTFTRIETALARAA